MSWRFAMEYNTTPQKSLGGLSPEQFVERGIARIEAARKMGKPLPLRSIMTKSVDEIERIFAIRVTARVTSNGVRYKYLEWTDGDFANRMGHQVDIHIPPGDVQEVWIWDPADNSWFKARGAWPHYMQGLPLAEHLRIRARLLAVEAAGTTDGSDKRRTLNFRRYMADHARLLRDLFALAGKDFVLDRGKKRNEKLWDRSRTVGHALDFAILSTCAAAVDIRENRVPPGWREILDLRKGADGVFEVVSIEAPKPGSPDGLWAATEDDDIDMMSDPLLQNGEEDVA
jgi:hypothetical protein